MPDTYDFLVCDIDEMLQDDSLCNLQLLEADEDRIVFSDNGVGYLIHLDRFGDYCNTWTDNLGHQHVAAKRIDQNN